LVYVPPVLLPAQPIVKLNKNIRLLILRDISALAELSQCQICDGTDVVRCEKLGFRKKHSREPIHPRNGRAKMADSNCQVSPCTSMPASIPMPVDVEIPALDCRNPPTLILRSVDPAHNIHQLTLPGIRHSACRVDTFYPETLSLRNITRRHLSSRIWPALYSLLCNLSTSPEPVQLGSARIRVPTPRPLPVALQKTFQPYRQPEKHNHPPTTVDFTLHRLRNESG
jgi:hypothetical protein